MKLHNGYTSIQWIILFCLNMSILEVKKQSTRPPENCVALRSSVPSTDGRISDCQQTKLKFEMSVPHLSKTILYMFYKYDGFSTCRTLAWGWLCYCTCSDFYLLYPHVPSQCSEEQRFNDFLKALREKVESKQLNHFWEIVIQGKLSFSPNIYVIFF